jgi:hypothetical protein
MTHLPNASLTKHQQNINNSTTPTGRVHVGTGSSFTERNTLKQETLTRENYALFTRSFG